MIENDDFSMLTNFHILILIHWIYRIFLLKKIIKQYTIFNSDICVSLLFRSYLSNERMKFFQIWNLSSSHYYLSIDICHNRFGGRFEKLLENKE